MNDKSELRVLPDAFDILDWQDNLHTIVDYSSGLDDSVVDAVEKTRDFLLGLSVVLRETPINPRRPLNDKLTNGYMESDRDFVGNNMEAAVRLLELFLGEAETEHPEHTEHTPIAARAWTDDRVIDVSFDAWPYLNNITDEVLFDLAAIGVRGDYPSDQVAYWTATYDSNLRAMFNYIETLMNAGRDIGFECAVDPQGFMDYVRDERPELWLKIQADEDVMEALRDPS
jgi:hypothetical protein